MNTTGERRHKPVIDYYTGPEGDSSRRSIAVIDSILSDFGTVDQLLAEIATSSTDPFTLVDVGCGQTATFLSEVLQQASLPTLAHVLKQKHLSLRAVGLTDAKKYAPLLSEQAIYIHPQTHQKLGEKVFYTLTAAQTLEALLAHKHVADVDFFLCSQSLMYLSPNVFVATMEAMITHLRVGGKILVYGVGYQAGPAPAFAGVDGQTLRSHPAKDGNLYASIGVQRTSVANVLNHFVLPNNIIATSLNLLEHNSRDVLEPQLTSLRQRILDRHLLSPHSSDDAIRPIVSIIKNLYQKRNALHPYSDEKLGEKVTETVKLIIHLRQFFRGTHTKQTQNQFSIKQAYIQALAQRPDLHITHIPVEDPSEGVTTYILEKKKSTDMEKS